MAKGILTAIFQTVWSPIRAFIHTVNSLAKGNGRSYQRYTTFNVYSTNLEVNSWIELKQGVDSLIFQAPLSCRIETFFPVFDQN